MQLISPILPIREIRSSGKENTGSKIANLPAMPIESQWDYSTSVMETSPGMELKKRSSVS